MHERLDINMHSTNNSSIVEKSNFNMSQHRAEVYVQMPITRMSARPCLSALHRLRAWIRHNRLRA